ncbi:MAG: SPASM domain-containing protein [Geobacteraceae bacterium]|nr:SPASM domain-containing protein [Geobacteraceae bacterium]
MAKQRNEKSAASQNNVLDAPALEITTNIGCPLACEYCPQHVLLAAYRLRSSEFMMTFDTFKSCLDKVPLAVAIDFSGMSEPWKNPDCTRMVRHASDRGHKIRIHTTLYGMGSDDVELLAGLSLDAFRVHLPGTGDLEKLDVDAEYLEVLEKVVELIPGARFVCFDSRPHSAVKALLNRYPLGKIRMASASNRADNECSDGKPLFFIGKGAIRCSNSARYNILLPNGDVTLCCMDYGLRHILGNLLLSGYDELFSGQEFKKVCLGFSDPSLRTLCRSCTVFGYHANILGDLCYRVPHWFASYRILRNWPQFIHSIKRNVRHYFNYLRKS